MRVDVNGAVQYDGESRWPRGHEGSLLLTTTNPWRQGTHLSPMTLDQIRVLVSRAEYVAVLGGAACLRLNVARVLRRDGLWATAGITGRECESGLCVSCSTFPADVTPLPELSSRGVLGPGLGDRPATRGPIVDRKSPI